MPETSPALHQILARNKAVFDWCLRMARTSLQQGRAEEACEWASHAAWLASSRGWFGTLCSRDLESVLADLALTLPPITARSPHRGPQHWVHIVTTAYDIGGHTNMLCRWIRADRSVIHHVLLTEQSAPVPAKLTGAVAHSGGLIHRLDPESELLEKSHHIRQLASRDADVVVLHHHPHDAASLVAFGRDGGPPVLLVNHADHLFWPGTATADLILEFREIGRQWTRKYRGSQRSVILPLPLEATPPLTQAGTSAQQEARRRLSWPESGVMLLAVASEYKFEPSGDWNFQETAREILHTCPQAWLVAVGPSARGPWRELQEAFPGRVFLPGPIDVSSPGNDVLAAADIGLGAFPFASQTSLLESGLQGLACVPTPRLIPYGFDDVSFQDTDWPATQEEYIAQAVALTHDPDHRLKVGASLRHKILHDHSGIGWMNHLDSVKSAIPRDHHPELPAPGAPLPESTAAFWARFTRLDAEHPLKHLHGRLIARHSRLQPKHDRALSAGLGRDDPFATFPGVRFTLGRLRFNAGRLRHRWLQRRAPAR